MRHSAISASIFALVLFLVAGCSSGPSKGPGPIVVAPSERDTPRDQDFEDDRYDRDVFERPDEDAFVTPLHLRGDDPVRVALLLPFSAPGDNAKRVASAMFDAAQLAAFEAGNDRFLLIPKDTRGTPDGAAAAARSALNEGAELILGPLFAESVEAVADIARSAETPVIAFSSDNRSAGNGIYLLSFPPEIEVKRVTDFAASTGITRFGLLAPANAYGERVSTAFADKVISNGGVVVHEERYEQNPDAMLAPAKRLAQYSKEVIPVELRHGYKENDESNQYTDDSGFMRGYQAVMMPEQGTLLRALAPLLPYYNVNINQVKLLGVSAWNNPRLAREPALRGGWFAAPDPDVSNGFKERYAAAFGQTPPRLASLSYDASLLAARLGQQGRTRTRFSDRAISNPNGYFGADGLFRLREDGTIERGLAVLEIQPGGAVVVDPAPKSFNQFDGF